MGEGEDVSTAVMLARMEGKIDTNFAIIRENQATQGAQVSDHESRMRALEANSPTRNEIERIESALSELNSWRWKLIGFFSAVSAIVAIAATIVTTIIENSITK